MAIPNNTILGTTHTTLISLGFRFAPAELRQMIFCEVFKDEIGLFEEQNGASRFPISSSKLPLISKALRYRDRELYQEALLAYSKTKRFYISRYDDLVDDDTSIAACELVQKLGIKLTIRKFPGGITPLSVPMLDALRHAKNIQDLAICIRCPHPRAWNVNAQELCELLVRRFVKGFPKLTKLILWVFNVFLTIDHRESVWTNGENVYEKSKAYVGGKGWGWPGWYPFPAIFDKVDQAFDMKKDEFRVSIHGEPHTLFDGSWVKMDIKYKCEWQAQRGKVLEWK